MLVATTMLGAFACSKSDQNAADRSSSRGQKSGDARFHIGCGARRSCGSAGRASTSCAEHDDASIELGRSLAEPQQPDIFWDDREVHQA